MQLFAASMLHVKIWLNVHRSLECWYVSCVDCSVVVWYVCGPSGWCTVVCAVDYLGTGVH